jgi:hypothetical protein
MNGNNCTGSGNIGHKPFEYNALGFSPCGKYVAHASNKTCDISNWERIMGLKDNPDGCQMCGAVIKTPCTCRTGSCACGDFISHKINEPCTAK